MPQDVDVDAQDVGAPVHGGADSASRSHLPALRRALLGALGTWR